MELRRQLERESGAARPAFVHLFMGKNRLKTVTAGRLVYAVCYSQPMGSDEPKERAAKSRLSSAARQRINFRHAWQKLELILAANFEPTDWWITLTYDDDHLPEAREDAQKYIASFMKRLRAQRKRQGRELLYVYNVEEMPDEPGEEKRLHHHLVIPRVPGDEEIIPSLWAAGLVDLQPLLDGQYDSYEARARYMVKERHPGVVGRKTGLRAWTSSRNLKKPEVTSELVPENITITPPPGAYVLDRAGDTNVFGSYIYIKYLLPVPRRGRQRRT